MKKKLMTIGLITCVLSLSACGSTSKTIDYEAQYGVSEVMLQEYGSNLIDAMNEIVATGTVEEYAADATIYSALESWENALEEIGEVIAVTDSTVAVSSGDLVVTTSIDGTRHEANVEIILDDTLNISSITTNVTYTFGELMKKAGLNTLIGMCTVFTVLILISFIISTFALIPKAQEAFKKKPKEAELKAQAVDNTIAQIAQKEELSDDTELVAVIAAAIAAYEGSGSTDGFVVRSIRKHR